MALVTAFYSRTKHAGDPQVASVLAPVGIKFERWGLSGLTDDTPPHLLLNFFKKEVDRLSRDRGYRDADVVALSTTPDDDNDLHGLLSKFSRKHKHSEDEVRFCVRGSGIFTVYPENSEPLIIELSPGELIMVPKGMVHTFHLTMEHNITAIRLFTDPTGWAAHYVD